MSYHKSFMQRLIDSAAVLILFRREAIKLFKDFGEMTGVFESDTEAGFSDLFTRLQHLCCQLQALLLLEYDWRATEMTLEVTKKFSAAHTSQL